MAGEIVVACRDVGEAIAGLRVHGFDALEVFPADAPRVAVLAGYGLRLRLEAAGRDAAVVLRLPAGGGVRERAVVAGIELVPHSVWAEAPLDEVVVPALVPRFSHVRAQDEGAWSAGRAGMRYRDLIPCRQGGRFIGSLIRIDQGGDVDDWVHFHGIRMQVIYCTRGWIRVAYEGQGAPIVMRPGDCVLQPPGIRHRVLAAEAGSEVVEIACPAEHVTRGDPGLVIGEGAREDGRAWGGQRFACVRGEGDLGIGDASGGLVVVRVVRGGDAEMRRHSGELGFTFVLGGRARLVVEGEEEREVGEGDAVVVPAGVGWRFDGELMRVELEVSSSASKPAGI